MILLNSPAITPSTGISIQLLIIIITTIIALIGLYFTISARSERKMHKLMESERVRIEEEGAEKRKIDAIGKKTDKLEKDISENDKKYMEMMGLLTNNITRLQDTFEPVVAHRQRFYNFEIVKMEKLEHLLFIHKEDSPEDKKVYDEFISAKKEAMFSSENK